MELVLAVGIGVLFAGGAYLLLRAHLFPVLLGLTLVSYAVNLLLIAAGRITTDTAPLVLPGRVEFPDPLPQALVLTAIVIGFAMTAVLVAVALRAYGTDRSEHVDGSPGDAREAGDDRGAGDADATGDRDARPARDAGQPEGRP